MKKLLLAPATAVCAVVVLSGTAGAGHGHFVIIENPASDTKTCQYIGEGQTDISNPVHGGFHRIHDNVHTGTPGTDGRGTTFDKEANEAIHRCDTVRRP